MPWERTVSESSALTIRLTVAGGGTRIIADGTAGDREDCQTLTRIVARLSIRRSHPGVGASDGLEYGGNIASRPFADWCNKRVRWWADDFELISPNSAKA
jgi:hypothetical protein